jgi:hypothetical protein
MTVSNKITQLIVKPNQVAQEHFLHDRVHKEVLYQGGWGSGKTYGAARKFLELHLYNQCPGLIIAPTYADIFRVCVKELVKACAEWHVYCEVSPRPTSQHPYAHMIIGGYLGEDGENVGGHVVYLISGDAPDRITGFEVGHCWIDEAARVRTSRKDPRHDTPTQARGRLRHPDAKRIQLILSTTPEGTANWIQRDFFEKKSANRAVYIGSSRKNKFLPEGYVEDHLEDCSEEMIKQYLDGEAVDFATNIAHRGFIDLPEISGGNLRSANFHQGITYIGCDFNVSPATAVACQVIRADQELNRGPIVGLQIIDELYIEDFATVDAMVREMDAKGWAGKNVTHNSRRVIFCPDKSAKNRSMTGDTQFEVLMKTALELKWKAEGDVEGRNPAVNDRIHLVSTYILNGKGERRLFVDPRCKRLREELTSTGRKRSGAYDEGPDKDRGHILDALGYTVWHVFSEEDGNVY